MALEHPSYRTGDVVINITGHDFGGLLKMGDMIAVLNVLEYMRKVNQNPNIKFHIPDTALQTEKEYIKVFRDFVMNNSDYISPTPGDSTFVGFVEIWSFREGHGDLIKINHNTPLVKKIAIFPLIDAVYNTERNFSPELLQEIINKYSATEYDEYAKVICIKDALPENIDVKSFTISHDFSTNLKHAVDCEYFIGGDTGVSHLVGAMNTNPDKKLIFYFKYGYHGGWASSFTAPFNYMSTNVKMIYFNEKLRAHENKADLAVLENMVVYNPVNPKMRIGTNRDGGYVLASNYTYDLLLSGGVGPEISFEHEFIGLFPNIKCILLDGTVDAPVLPVNTTFVKKNIGRYNNDHYTNLVEYIGDAKDIFLKMDIEGGEWELFTSEFANHLHKVKQIVLEVHHIFSTPVAAKVFETLGKTHNIIHVHENNHCRDFYEIGGNLYPHTIELTYLRKDCRVIGLNDQMLPLPVVDFPNTDHFPNLDINHYPFNIKTNK